MINVVLAEDHQSLIDGIKVFLEYEEDICVVGEANDGEKLVEIACLKRPHIVLTDIRMPKMDGIAAAKLIKKQVPGCKIIAFTMFDQDDAVSQMQAAGASGYIMKNSSLKTVVTAIRAVAKGGEYFDANIKPLQKLAQDDMPLSKRELEIVRLVGEGKTSQEIADILYIGKTTVDTHRKNILRKLNLQGKTELLRYSVEKKYDF
jgi:two-component system, NarL family, response regulator NreC